MPRNISTAAANYAGPLLWLADITTRTGTTHFFAEDQLLSAGHTYLPYLRVAQGPCLHRSLQADAGEITLLNADLFIGNLLLAEDFEGARCDLKQLLVGIDEAVFIFRGLLTDQEETDLGVRFRLLSELDPAQLELHSRSYAQLCTWRFSRPDKLTPCGYAPDSFNFSQPGDNEMVADIFSENTLGSTAQSWIVDQHRDRIVVITQGTGRAQKRRIRSNTATSLTLYHQWDTVPDATSRFDIWQVSAGGLPKLLTHASFGGELLLAATVAGPRTIGSTGGTMIVDEHASDIVFIEAGPGAGQRRRIQSNTATSLTIADDEPDFNPLPTSSSVWMVLFRRCPKDFAPSCEDRARTEAFNGFPTLVPIVQRAAGRRSGPLLPDLGDTSPRGHNPILP